MLTENERMYYKIPNILPLFAEIVSRHKQKRTDRQKMGKTPKLALFFQTSMFVMWRKQERLSCPSSTFKDILPFFAIMKIPQYHHVSVFSRNKLLSQSIIFPQCCFYVVTVELRERCVVVFLFLLLAYISNYFPCSRSLLFGCVLEMIYFILSFSYHRFLFAKRRQNATAGKREM